MLRIAANENVPGPAVALLRSRGHDVWWGVEDGRGWQDPRVLERAAAEGRVLVTFDKDFGELVFRAGLPAAHGVVLLRISGPSPESVAATIAQVLEAHAHALTGHFTVVDDTRVRIVPLPRASPDEPGERL